MKESILEIVALFFRGGIVMYPILALSILGLALLFFVALSTRSKKVKVSTLSRALLVVSTIITAEPMLGILGTVTGIIRTFHAFNADASHVINPLSATAGIGEALITTAAGLVASLILIFPYNVLDSRVAEMSQE